VCKPPFDSIDCVNVTLQTASKQYWEKYVLSLKPDGLAVFGDLGEVRWQLLLCFLLSWIIVFLCVMKGVKSSGKVVYFTATFPYVILISILIRGVTLDGAWIGISYFFVPVWEELLDLQVWRKAAEQMFYSLSISWGGLILFGSYNEFRNRVHVDAFVVSLLDFLTSIIAGIATFSILGAISSETGVDIKEIASSGSHITSAILALLITCFDFASNVTRTRIRFHHVPGSSDSTAASAIVGGSFLHYALHFGAGYSVCLGGALLNEHLRQIPAAAEEESDGNGNRHHLSFHSGHSLSH